MERYVCIHGHFYQPPRENPWVEAVEFQESAYPHHDWNERVTAECYAPNAAARILDSQNRIKDIINNYARISFNFGPTLLSWLERYRPEVYAAVLDADRLSQARFSGHGSALAQVYNHMIMPLANHRDKETQVIWGLRDFETRFKRKPEGMWLSETAVDVETLEILAQQGISFTVLDAPQARRIKRPGEEKWHDINGGALDPRRPYRCPLPSGRTINLFFYDGPIARDVAFGGLLNNGEQFAQRLVQVFTEDKELPDQLVHIATDGETYGHHHRYGDMALAYALHNLESRHGVKLTVYGEFLEKYPPTWDVEIAENTSWSCFHGVERWRDDCGCNSGLHPGFKQTWRKPLRQAMDTLRDRVAEIYDREMKNWVQDPWTVRNEYIDVILDRSPAMVERFFARHVPGALKAEEKVRLLELVEMQRHAMLMYTSCGWFFDDVVGIETLQVMQYAARALQLARSFSALDLETEFKQQLHLAPCNTPGYAQGEAVWDHYVAPAVTDLNTVGVHYAVTSLFNLHEPQKPIYCYRIEQEDYQRVLRGEEKLAMGRIRIRSQITWEEVRSVFAVLHLGGHHLIGGVRLYQGEETYRTMQREIEHAFDQGDVPEVIRLMDDHFGSHNYSFRNLFKDEQRHVLNRIMENTLQETEAYFRNIYTHHYPMIQIMRDMRIPLPKILSTTVEYVLNMDFNRALEEEPLDQQRLRDLAKEIQQWGFKRDKTTMNFMAGKVITRLLKALESSPGDMHALQQAVEVLDILQPLELDLDLWEAQNSYHAVDTAFMSVIKGGAEKAASPEWIEWFNRLGQSIGVAHD